MRDCWWDWKREWTYKSISWARLPIDEGIVPVNWFEERYLNIVPKNREVWVERVSFEVGVAGGIESKNEHTTSQVGQDYRSMKGSFHSIDYYQAIWKYNHKQNRDIAILKQLKELVLMWVCCFMELEKNIQLDNVSFRVTGDPIPGTTGRACPSKLSAPFCLHVLQSSHFTAIQGVHLVCNQQREEEKDSSCVGVLEERHSLLVLDWLRTWEKTEKRNIPNR